MVKLPSLLAAPILALVLSLALFSSGVFAQSTTYHGANSAQRSVAAQPAGTVRPYDGPSPVENGFGGGGPGGYGNGGYGNGGYGNGGYGNGGNGGYGNGLGWHRNGCASHHCGFNTRSASRCERFSRTFRSDWIIKRQGFSACKWIKAEHW